MEHLLREEDPEPPRRFDLTKMKRTVLITKLRQEQRRTQAMGKRKDEMKAALVQCNKLLTDTRQLHQQQIQELANERDSLLQQLQQELGKNESLRQQIEEQDLSRNIIVESTLREREAQESHLHVQIGELELQKNNLEQKVNEVNEKLGKIHEENCCSICLMPWETDGAHRLVSLNCGHLFGDSCIRQHLERLRECAVCKQTVYMEDLRCIFGLSVLVAVQAAPSRLAAPPGQTDPLEQGDPLGLRYPYPYRHHLAG
ncbi:E3 ubiquitin-protein ligase RNF8-like [Drosophila takahashii]|uniref:E3 ubiquitin-protein ligase RNF8-like n=1 Tax=Drosophila takahashii TaxID=29030 RepID=UPI0038990A3B